MENIAAPSSYFTNFFFPFVRSPYTFSASFLLYAIVVSPLNRFPKEGNCSAFQSFSCSNQEISNGLIRTILPFSNLRNLAVFVDVIVRDPIFSSGKSLQAAVEDFILPSHHMDRQDIPFMLFRIIRFF